MTKNKFEQNYQNIVYGQKQAVVNQHSKNQTVYYRLPVVPGKSSNKDATDRDKFYERDLSIFSDSIPKEFNSCVSRGKLETVIE